MNAEERLQQEQATESRQRSEQAAVMRCANCDIEILWSPTVVQGKVFCCVGCAAGGPCSCDYSQYQYLPAKVSHAHHDEHKFSQEGWPRG
jgi:hypothetical protein